MTDHLRIAPFAGYRYNAEKVPELSEVIAPPYDMISPAEQRQFHERHQWNIVRLILSGDEEEAPHRNRYEIAADYYRRWKQERILLQDPEPSIYAYRQDYQWDGNTYQRLGFIARVALTEFGKGAFPHESTLSGPKADRLKLLKECRANFSSIFALFSDSGEKVLDRLGAETASPPLVEVRDDKGVEHRLWRLSRPEFHRWLDEQMRDRQFIIADGHHRYETALEYRRLMAKEGGGDRVNSDYVMMFLAPIESPGLTILPFHRVLDRYGCDEVLSKVSAAFDVTEFAVGADGEQASGKIRETLEKTKTDRPVYVLCGGGESAYLLTMKTGFDRTPHLREGTSSKVGSLDVTVLHQVVFGSLLGLDEPSLVQEGRVSFHARPEDILKLVRAEGEKTAFFLRPTRMEQVWDIAISGEKMPQKSTNFYPKLTTGLVINEL